MHVQVHFFASCDMQPNIVHTYIFSAKVEEEGGNVKTLLHRDGTVRVLTVTTAKMKAAFCGSDPSVLQVDTTFNYETSGYKLSAFLYLNPTTNKGEVGQLSFMGDEGGVAYQFAFTTFRSICLRDPPVIIIDKVDTFSKYFAQPKPKLKQGKAKGLVSL